MKRRVPRWAWWTAVVALMASISVACLVAISAIVVLALRALGVVA